MSALFFDSSSLVKRYAKETGTNWVFSLVRPSANNRLYLARITGVEVVAALTKRMRVGSLTTPPPPKLLTDLKGNSQIVICWSKSTPQIIRNGNDFGKKSYFARLRCRSACCRLQVESRPNFNRRFAADFYFSR